MNAIAGLVVTVVMVFGGYMLAGGHLDIIMHSLPFEMMMIGGAATGAFLAGNDMTTIKHAGGDMVAAFAGPKWKKSDYQDLLCLMHELLNVLKKNPVDIETHIEAPQDSDIFAKYPKILKDKRAIEMICDTIRSMIMNFDNVHQVEELLEKQLDSLIEEKLHGSHALQNMADALPALGIVAAVLGVIKTMASIDKPPEVLGGMIGGALEFGGPTSDQWFAVPDYPDPAPDSVTVSIWVWANSLVPSGNIVGNTSDTVPAGQFGLGLTENGENLVARTRTKNGDVSVISDTAVFPVGSWQHVAYVFEDYDPAEQSGGEARLYRNGQLVAFLRTTDGASGFRIGFIAMGALLADWFELAFDDDPGLWDGKMDDFGFWARALATEEIVGIYEAGLEGKDLTQAQAPIPPQLPLDLTVRISSDAGQITITWDAGGAKLQSTGTLADAASWDEVLGAISPHTEDATEAHKYFRVTQP